MLISVYTRSGGMQDASTAFVTLGPQGNTYILPFVIPPFKSTPLCCSLIINQSAFIYNTAHHLTRMGAMFWSIIYLDHNSTQISTPLLPVHPPARKYYVGL